MSDPSELIHVINENCTLWLLSLHFPTSPNPTTWQQFYFLFFWVRFFFLDFIHKWDHTLSFCVWPISLGTMLSRCIYDIANGKIFFFFMAKHIFEQDTGSSRCTYPVTMTQPLLPGGTRPKNSFQMLFTSLSMPSFNEFWDLTSCRESFLTK